MSHRDSRRRELALGDLSELWDGDEGVYFAHARRSLNEAERLLKIENQSVFRDVEAEWDNDSLRDEVLDVVRSAGQHALAPRTPTSPPRAASRAARPGSSAQNVTSSH
jgi:hypothetical protein